MISTSTSDANSPTGVKAIPRTGSDFARTAVWTVVFGGAGVLHFLRPAGFDSLVPTELPGSRRLWTVGSGVLELGLAAAIACPATRTHIGRPAAVFLLGVLPGNIKMALDWQRDDRKSLPLKVGAWVRVAGQLPMIGSVLKLH